MQSHEDKHTEGIPDLSYGLGGICGWIELKQIREVPRRAEDIMKPQKYTPLQVNWLSKRGKKGGNCFVMVKVGTTKDVTYWIFNFDKAKMVAGGMSMVDYRRHCLGCWHSGINPGELAALLS
jgi:hypothetical protein